MELSYRLQKLSLLDSAIVFVDLNSDITVNSVLMAFIFLSVLLKHDSLTVYMLHYTNSGVFIVDSRDDG